MLTFEDLDTAIAKFEKDIGPPEKILMGQVERAYLDIQAIRSGDVALTACDQTIGASYRGLPIEVRESMNGFAIAGMADTDIYISEEFKEKLNAVEI